MCMADYFVVSYALGWVCVCGMLERIYLHDICNFKSSILVLWICSFVELSSLASQTQQTLMHVTR